MIQVLCIYPCTAAWSSPRTCWQHHHVHTWTAHARYAASSDSTTRMSHCTFMNTEDPARFCSASIKPLLLHLCCIYSTNKHMWLTHPVLPPCTAGHCREPMWEDTRTQPSRRKRDPPSWPPGSIKTSTMVQQTRVHMSYLQRCQEPKKFMSDYNVN